MKQYLSVVIVLVVCVLAVVCAALWRFSHKEKQNLNNYVPNEQPSNVLIYNDNVNIYQ